jgi:hypothetical protein
MRLPSTKFVVLNAAAGVVTVAALLAVVRSIFFAPAVGPCSERYRNMTAFALERSGVLLTAADLQAGVSGRDAGVIENVAIARVKDAPAPFAMSVSLSKGSASPRWAGGAKGGMSYPWEPRSLQGRSAACLAYHVLLPADFDFHRGGVLPGLIGADGVERGDGFLARLVWRPAGRGGVAVRLSDGAASNAGTTEADAFDFPRGRWVKLEQEVVLNTPKKADGTLRVWVDGALAVERTDIAYRGKSEVALAGVAVDVHYGAADAVGAAPKDTKVWLSPFQIRWQ